MDLDPHSSFLSLNEYLRQIDRDSLSDDTDEYRTPTGWAPTPLNPYNSPEITQRQSDVHDELERRFEQIPDDLTTIPKEVCDFVGESFNTRFINREMANFDNFAKRLKQDLAQFDDAQQSLIKKAVEGTASPAETMYVRMLLEIGSVELGCVTHPYGNNIELLDIMRQTVAQAVSQLNGTQLDEPSVFKVKQADNFYMQHMAKTMNNAFLMTRKRDIARMRDGSVVRERSSFIVRIDPDSGFNQHIAGNLRGVLVHHNPDWSEHMTIAAGALDTIIPPLLESNEFSKVIPLSTTIYNFHAPTCDTIKENEQKVNLAKRALGKNDPLY